MAFGTNSPTTSPTNLPTNSPVVSATNSPTGNGTLQHSGAANVSGVNLVTIGLILAATNQDVVKEIINTAVDTTINAANNTTKFIGDVVEILSNEGGPSMLLNAAKSEASRAIYGDKTAALAAEAGQTISKS